MGLKADGRGYTYDSGNVQKKKTKVLTKTRTASETPNAGVLVLDSYQSKQFYACIEKTKEPTGEYKATANRLKELLVKIR